MADPSLGGRVERRTRASGGLTDRLYDGIVCELKVVDDNGHARDRGPHEVRPTQYVSALSAQLSILCWTRLQRAHLSARSVSTSAG